MSPFLSSWMDTAGLRAKALTLFFILTSILHVSCGSSESGAITFGYELERQATNQGANAILLKFPPGSGYYFRISGDHIQASVPIDVLVPVQERIELSASALGVYPIDLIFALPDKTEFMQDTLQWEYGLEHPPEPIVSFSEEASSDGNVLLLVSSSRGPSVHEIWVEGDVVPNGEWHMIPSSGKVPIELSAGDGLKDVTFRLRNRYGNESKSRTMSILRKSQGPSQCAIEPITETVADQQLRIRLSAVNEGDLYYRVLGDVEKNPGFKKIQSGSIELVKLLEGTGLRTLTVMLRDQAENYCPPATLKINIDPSYKPYSLSIDEPLVWTDNFSVSATLRYDAFAEEAIEMYIDGGVEPGPDTHQWVPFKPNVPLQLTPFEGNRFVFVQFRRAGVLSQKINDAIYLRPYLHLSGSGPTRTLSVSNIIGLSRVSISGCVEDFTDVNPASTLVCTVNGPTVQALYQFPDGTSVLRSAVP